ncbi:MAG: cytochrome P450, partial [Woeseiaceae bacterium]
RFKSAHQRFFLPPAIRSGLERNIEEHAHSLITGFEPDGSAELRSQFASRLPILTMLSLFGLDASEEAQLRVMYDDFEAALSNFTRDPDIRARGIQSAARFHELIQHYLDGTADTADPDSLLTSMAESPDRLSDPEIRRNALIVFFGGISTVEALILNTLYALSTAESVMDRVRDELTLLPSAITESIRWLSPVQSATRHVARESELHGVRFSKGDTVNCMLASANRDPVVFDDPDVFDIGRSDAATGISTRPRADQRSERLRVQAAGCGRR